MAEKAVVIDSKKLWGGGESPFQATYGKLMMWFFLLSDAFTFSSLLASYGMMRAIHADEWANAEEVFNAFPFLGEGYPLLYVALMTFILIMSSVTMVLAVEAGHRMNKKGVVMWLVFTVIGGAIFLGSQAWEWYHFIHGSESGAVRTIYENGAFVTKTVHGANLHYNEYGHKLFGDFFFFITGFHGFHVFSGVILNIIILIMTMNNTFHKRGHYEMVEKVGLYWHFVDLVWVFVFTFFYLI